MRFPLSRNIARTSHWTEINSGLPPPLINAIAIDPSNTSTIFVILSRHGVFKSTNRGETWKLANTGLEGAFANVLAIDPSDSKVIYAAANSELFKTTDRGETWVKGKGKLTPDRVTQLR